MHKSFITITLFLLLTVLSGCGKDGTPPRDYNLTLYAAAYGGGIYKSDNGGTSWYPLNMDQSSIYSYYKKLYRDPDDGGSIYVATAGAGLFVIDESKETLEKAGAFNGSVVTAMAFGGPRFPGAMNYMIGLNDDGIYRTGEFHGPWESMHKGLSFRHVNTILSLDNNLLLAGTSRDLFGWDGSTQKWTARSAGIRNKNIISLGSAQNGQVLYAGAGAYQKEKGRFEEIPCLYKSMDRGATWQASDKGIPDDTLVYALALNPDRPERIFIGTSNGIFLSENSGKSWEKESDGLAEELKIFSIKMARVSPGPDVVYAAGSGGVFMKVDDDKTPWQAKGYGLDKTAITDLLVKNESTRPN